MICHVCNQPATGQCQVCWKFYCPAHGDVLCQPCEERERAVRDRVASEYEQQAGRSLATLALDEQPLQRVVGVGQIARRGTTEIDLVYLEFHPGGFIGHFRIRSGHLSRPPVPFASTVGLRSPKFIPETTDDLGNIYDSLPSGGGGNRQQYRYDFYFRPALAAQARGLFFRVTEVQWHVHGSGPGGRSLIEPGPWQFHVGL